jgi:hypothetical protein
MSSAPSPPPLPLTAVKNTLIPSPAPKPPVVPSTGPTGSLLVQLLIFNGSPFKDHWAFWVRSCENADIGVQIHAAGDVMSGFEFEIKRSHDLGNTADRPTSRVPLQWVDAKYFDEKAMFNAGKYEVADVPVCGFEASAHKIKVPEKSLNAINEKVCLLNFTCNLCLQI